MIKHIKRLCFLSVVIPVNELRDQSFITRWSAKIWNSINKSRPHRSNVVWVLCTPSTIVHLQHHVFFSGPPLELFCFLWGPEFFLLYATLFLINEHTKWLIPYSVSALQENSPLIQQFSGWFYFKLLMIASSSAWPLSQ